MRAILPPLTAGFLAALVAYSSTIAVVIQGLAGVGATPAEAASGVLAISLVMGIGGIVYCALSRIPVSIAWSSPGAAFLAVSGMPEGGFSAAVGAFLLAGALTVLAGLVRPVAMAFTRIPVSLTSAMLAGILFDLCLAPVRALAERPLSVGCIVAVFLVMSRFRPLLAVPAATAAMMAFLVTGQSGDLTLSGPLVPPLIFTMPVFEPSALLGIGLPLFLISMASQNLPGLAILRANGFEPAPGRLFAVLGGLGILAAPFGGHSVILAAITGSLCAGESAGPDRSRRWIAGVVAGLFYIAFGLSATLLVAVMAGSPLLVASVAGLALIGVFAACLRTAMERDGEREAATVAFLVTASGLAIFGLSAAVWGLVAGGAVLALRRLGALSR